MKYGRLVKFLKMTNIYIYIYSIAYRRAYDTKNKYNSIKNKIWFDCFLWIHDPRNRIEKQKRTKPNLEQNTDDNSNNN